MRRILSVYDKSAFEITENFLRVTFYYDAKVTSDVTKNVTENVTETIRLNTTQQKIINAILHNKNVTTSELASIVGISKRQILRNMKILTDAGFLSRVGTHRVGSWLINESALQLAIEERKLFEEIAPLAKQLQALYKKIDKMLADGLITQEQYDDMMWVPGDDAEEND
jgi:transcription initiation factor IIE alpha subunit